MTTMSQHTGVPTIRFDATLYTIDKSAILRLPEKASGKLPSRGQVAVQGTINGHGFRTVVEPDGYFGHRILRQLWQLPLRRSKTYGKVLRRWRAGNGFAGSMQPKTLIRANDGSK